MQEGYVEVAGVPSHIMTWGKWIEEPWKNTPKELCLVITGNPGLPGFYTTFCKTLHESLNIPVWVIGHAGHDNPPKRSNIRTLDLIGNERLFDLKGQVYHKAEFINKYVPDDVKIHLIGHSIGAYCGLELLKRPSIKSRIIKEYLLFPTLERMATSPNGKFFTKLFPRLIWLALLIFWLFNLLPYRVRALFVYFYFSIFRIQKHFVGTALKYARPSVVHKVIFMAVDEMEHVKELDVNIVQQNEKLLKLYYGTTDGWAPVRYYYDLKLKFPYIDAEVCQRGMEHAFVLRRGPEMGHMVADWIKENLS